MKQSDIQVGRTYRNGGAGRTTRKVLAIGNEHRPKVFYSGNEPPDEPGVLFTQNGRELSLYLSSFAAWCGEVIEE